MGRWGSDFDPDRLAELETGMWKAYYRRQPARLFGLLIRGLHEQAKASWPSALAAGILLTKAAVGFARSSGDYARFGPTIARAYRMLGLPPDVNAEEVARWELRWWVVRREIDAARIGAEQLVAALQEDRALAGEKEHRRGAADQRRRKGAGHHELVVALDAAPHAAGGAEGAGHVGTVTFTRRHDQRFEMPVNRLAALIGQYRRRRRRDDERRTRVMDASSVEVKSLPSSRSCR